MKFPVAFLFAAALGTQAVAAPSAAWENIGPEGGLFSAMAADSMDSLHVVLFSADAIWETRDTGASWRKLPAACVNLVGAQVRGDAFYVNCGYELKASADAGATWRTYSRTNANDSIRTTYLELEVHPSLPALAITTTHSTFEVTRDDGSSWTASDNYPFFLAKPVNLAFDPRSRGRVLGIMTQSASRPGTTLVQRTVPDGDSWSEVTTLPGFNPVANPACSGDVVAIGGDGTYYVNSNCGVWVSRDEGKSWENFVPHDMWTGTSTATIYAASQRAGRAAVRTASRIMVTDDGGRSWANLVSGQPVDMAMAPDGTIWTTEAGHIYRYDSSGRARMPLQLRQAGITAYDVSATNANILYANSQLGQVRSLDGGSTWLPMPTASDIRDFVAVPGQPSAVYGRYAPLRLWFSGDSGASWSQVPLPPVPAPYQYYDYFAPVGPQPGVIYAMWTGSTGGFPENSQFLSAPIRSTDGGRTWTRIDGGLDGSGGFVTPARSDVATAYATTTTGLFRTRDGGASWRKVAATSGYSSISVDSRDPLVVYVRASEGITVSEDGGDHWRAVPAPTSSDSVAALLPDPVDARRAFALTSAGSVFETRDAAVSWRRVLAGSGTAFPVETRIAARGEGRSIFVPNAGSLWSLDLSKARPIALGTDLWFNPAQPGWGLSIAQHDTHQVFVVWFTYDANGEPTWRFIPGGAWLDATTFTGTLYKATVPAKNFFLAAFTPPTITPAGSATLRFSNADSGEATFNVDGVVVRQPIVRMAFGPKAGIQPGIADLWFNAAQPGWGISLHQQYSNVFGTWFLFGTDGAPTWLFMPDATLRDGVTSGDVYRASSVAGMPYQAGSIQVTRMGTATITSRGELSSSVGGISWTSPLARLPF